MGLSLVCKYRLGDGEDEMLYHQNNYNPDINGARNFKTILPIVIEKFQIPNVSISVAHVCRVNLIYTTYCVNPFSRC